LNSHIIVFDIGSTLIHPSMEALAKIIGPEAVGAGDQHLARAFA
jgi:hypothetical protein